MHSQANFCECCGRSKELPQGDVTVVSGWLTDPDAEYASILDSRFRTSPTENIPCVKVILVLPK